MRLEDLIKLQDHLIEQLKECEDTDRSVELSMEIRKLKEQIDKRAQRFIDEERLYSLMVKMNSLHELTNDEINILIHEHRKALTICIELNNLEDAEHEIEALIKLQRALELRNKNER